MDKEQKKCLQRKIWLVSWPPFMFFFVALMGVLLGYLTFIILISLQVKLPIIISAWGQSANLIVIWATIFFLCGAAFAIIIYSLLKMSLKKKLNDFFLKNKEFKVVLEEYLENLKKRNDKFKTDLINSFMSSFGHFLN